MAIGTLTLEKVQELIADKNRLNDDVEELRGSTAKSLWLKDLDALDQQLDEQDKKDAKAEVARIALKSKVMNDAGLKGVRQVKNPRKNNNTKKVNKNASNVETLEPSAGVAMETENVAEPAKPKGRGGARKAPAKKQQKPALVDEDDDEVLELKERLAAYNLDSSPEQSAAMDVEEIQGGKNEPSKLGKNVSFAAKEKVGKNDDSDEDFELEIIAEPKGAKKGGRKPATKAKEGKPPAAPRKRGPAKKQLVGQKLINDMLKPAEISPDNKVRKTRDSPFNKKSGSVLDKIDSSGEKSGSSDNLEDEMNEVVPARPRPQRVNRQVKRYVISDSETEEEATGDSDFDLNDD